MRAKAIVVAGVSGAGKSTVGRALAARLGWSFVEADDYHSAANKAKMHAGHPLTDADRADWLQQLRRRIDAALHGEPIVLACSALKHAYREILRRDAPVGAVKFVYLEVAEPVLRARVAHRHHAFAPPALLDSQLATLEPPVDALRVDGTCSVEDIVSTIVAALGLD